MGKLRTSDTDDFPVSSRSGGINYILVTSDGDYQHFKSTKGDKESLLSRLRDIPDPDECHLLGVWEGKYRSDTFDLDMEQFRQRLQQEDL